MKVIYYIFVYIYIYVVKIASVFNPKAKLWVNGRKDILTKIKSTGISEKQIIWVHCASLGEFEQGRPIIEKFKNLYPNHKILLTFFSPSGYEVRKDYELADYVFYLPMDTISNARQFVNIVRPKLVVFIKYEFWFNYIDELYIQKIPLIFVSVIFRPSQLFFKSWGSWFVRQLNKVSYIFVQNEESINLLDSIGVHHVEISGDTRFDRVIQLPEDTIEFPIIKNFKDDVKLVIAGSTWQPGEKILFSLLEKSDCDFKLIIAPHIVSKEHVEEIMLRFKQYNPVLYSNGSTSNLKQSRVMIIDSIGLLSLLYRYADIAYVGGGFGVGIHNLLEASTYGMPVLFGPNYKRFREAIDLRDLGGGFPIENSEELIEVFHMLMLDQDYYNNCSGIAKNYVINNAGATQLIVSKVKEFIVTS